MVAVARRQGRRHRRAVVPPPAPAPRLAPELEGLEFVVMDVTPEMAAHWLEGKCPNRNVTDSLVRQYAKDMLAGAWHLNGETVVFTKEPALLNGQHRLWAIVESGCTVKLCIVFGADEGSMDTYDMGRARSFADTLKINGYENGGRAMAGAAKWLRWYESFRKGGLHTGGKPSHAELKAVVERHPTTEEAAQMVSSSKAKRLVQPAILTFVMTMALERDREKAERWLEAMATGQNLPSNSGTYLFREKMISLTTSTSKLDPMYVAAYAVKAWNAWYKGRTMAKLKWGSTGGKPESFPDFED